MNSGAFDIDSLIERDDLYFTEFPGGYSFTWRLLTLKEYRRFSALRHGGQFHKWFLYWKVYERCVDGAKGLTSGQMPMGIPVSLGETIMYLSGDCETETVREDILQARDEYSHGGDLMEQLKRIILLAFPTQDFGELNHLNRSALIRLFTQAEAMLGVRHGENYKPVDVANIIPLSELQRADVKTGLSRSPLDGPSEPIDFEKENMSISKHVHPWDEVDRVEKEWQEKQESKKTLVSSKPAKLTKEQMAKLRRS